MRILILVPDMNVGGVTTVVKNLAEGLRVSGNSVKIVSIKQVENMDNLNIHKKIELFKGLIKLNNIIKKYEPELVHSHTIFSHILALLYKVIFNRSMKIVCTEHGSLQKKQRNKLVFILFKFLSKFANQIVFVSEFSLNSYIQNRILRNKKLKVIYNGIKIKFLFNSNKDINKPYSFCFIGRFSPEKNLYLLIDAFEILNHQENKRVNLFLIGNGDEYKNIIDYCFEKKMNNISFLGYKDNISEFIKLMDCIVLSSLTEGLPTVILEAYSQKKLAISTNCGGVKEIIRDDNFISKDFKAETLADRMKYVINLSEVEKEKNKIYNLKLLKDKFSLKNMILSYIELYKNIIQRE